MLVDPVQNLALNLHLTRTPTRRLTFDEFFAAVHEYPLELLRQCTRAGLRRLKHKSPVCASTVSQRCLISNAWCEAVLTTQSVLFTEVSPADVRRHLLTLEQRDYVRMLIYHRNHSSDPRPFSRAIEECGGEDMSTVVCNEAMRELHFWAVNAFFDLKMGRHHLPAIIICVHHGLIVDVVAHIPPTAFECCAMTPQGAVCGAVATRRCTRCKKAFYCCKRCARNDKPFHEVECTMGGQSVCQSFPGPAPWALKSRQIKSE